VKLVATTLYVADLDKALDWYREQLGWVPASEGSDGHRYAAFSFGGALVVLEPIEAALEPAARGSENTTLNVMIDRDPVEVREALLARGVECGEVVLSGFASFLMRDLDGNRFYITRPR
jgi:catechol 2,3-dioxygenase-like lactoylglutathione lyase family enzyme